MAPEIIMENIYNEKADVFSFGMVMAEILSRVAPDMKNFIRQMPDFGIDPVCFHLFLLLLSSFF